MSAIRKVDFRTLIVARDRDKDVLVGGGDNASKTGRRLNSHFAVLVTDNRVRDGHRRITPSVFCPPNSMWAYNSETNKSFLNPNTTISSSFEDTDDPPVIPPAQDVFERPGGLTGKHSSRGPNRLTRDCGFRFGLN